MYDPGDWVEVVPALPAAEADAAWDAWLAERAGRPLDLTEVVIDTGGRHTGRSRLVGQRPVSLEDQLDETSWRRHLHRRR